MIELLAAAFTVVFFTTLAMAPLFVSAEQADLGERDQGARRS